MTTLTNWAGNVAYGATAVHEPRSLDELQAIVRGGGTLRPLGSRHSFSDVADTTGAFITWRRMPRRFGIDAEAMTVTIDGGGRYGEICEALDDAGFALPNLASLPHISVAGACATATHGSGDRLGNLATAVVALSVVTAAGDRVELIDGGYCANNPALYALADATEALGRRRDEIRLLSLGVGHYPVPKRSLLEPGVLRDSVKHWLARKVLDVDLLQEDLPESQA